MLNSHFYELLSKIPLSPYHTPFFQFKISFNFSIYVSSTLLITTTHLLLIVPVIILTNNNIKSVDLFLIKFHLSFIICILSIIHVCITSHQVLDTTVFSPLSLFFFLNYSRFVCTPLLVPFPTEALKFKQINTKKCYLNGPSRNSRNSKITVSWPSYSISGSSKASKFNAAPIN